MTKQLTRLDRLRVAAAAGQIIANDLALKDQGSLQIFLLALHKNGADLKALGSDLDIQFILREVNENENPGSQDQRRREQAHH